jgi:hypothetical protein
LELFTLYTLSSLSFLEEEEVEGTATAVEEEDDAEDAPKSTFFVFTSLKVCRLVYRGMSWASG